MSPLAVAGDERDYRASMQPRVVSGANGKLGQCEHGGECKAIDNDRLLLSFMCLNFSHTKLVVIHSSVCIQYHVVLTIRP